MTKTQKSVAAQIRPCPVCGEESWPIVYGLVLNIEGEERPKVEYAGCCILMEDRENRMTGEVESGAAVWACQNKTCRLQCW